MCSTCRFYRSHVQFCISTFIIQCGPYPCDFRPLINSYQGGLQQPDNILICCGYQYTLLMRESLHTHIIICVATILMPYPYQGDSPRWYEDFCVVQKYECEWYENNIFIIILKNILCVCMCVYMCVCDTNQHCCSNRVDVSKFHII